MLTLIATPLGNLKDITERSLEALKNCDVILCEDTRRTLALLSAYGISKKLLRYSDHIERTAEQACALMLEGKKLCLATDGGMPCVSDPGWKLVKKALDLKLKVEVLPGPSAVTAALAGSGFPADSFVFLGFLPRSEGKIVKNLKAALALGKPAALYESPYRFKKFLDIICRNFEGIEVVAVRELSKAFEEWLRGTPGEILEKLGDREVKGEITVVLRQTGPERSVPDPDSMLFVCTGNTCRSVMASYYAEKLAATEGLNLKISSAGILADPGTPQPEIMKKILALDGLDASKHVPVQLNESMISRYGVVVTMTSAQKEVICGFLPDACEKVFPLIEYAGLGRGDIPDPYGRTEMEYEMTFRTVKNSVKAVFENLKKR